ncbi:MAG TPA: hypothetical protein VMJ92_02830 [Candidatus Limnocylindrales bacterium]|nr:hypothetical protein [Candidatus Limnocylindrales bacterium]
MSELDLRAVAIGVAVDILGSIVIGGALLIAAGAMLGASTTEALEELFDVSVELQVFSLLTGLLFVVIGAFVAARVAKRDELQHAFAVGVISTAVSFSCVFMAPEALPFWYEAVALILTIPVAFVGGWVALALDR